MTLQELYTEIGGNYEMALRVLRIDRLIDKHIRKFAASDLADRLKAAAAELDPTVTFDAAHAIKGVSGNLGLGVFYDKACVLSDEFRKGSQRTMSDEEVRSLIDSLVLDFEHLKAAVDTYA